MTNSYHTVICSVTCGLVVRPDRQCTPPCVTLPTNPAPSYHSVRGYTNGTLQEGQGQPPRVHGGTGSASACTRRDRVSLPVARRDRVSLPVARRDRVSLRVYTEGQGQPPRVHGGTGSASQWHGGTGSASACTRRDRVSLSVARRDRVSLRVQGDPTKSITCFIHQVIIITRLNKL